jgi:hypothetical protein
MSWLPAWLLACALTAATPAIAQPAPTPEPTGEQVKAFLENRSDPVVGAWVARELQPDGAASAAPAPDATVRKATAPLAIHVRTPASPPLYQLSVDEEHPHQLAFAERFVEDPEGEKRNEHQQHDKKTGKRFF